MDALNTDTDLITNFTKQFEKAATYYPAKFSHIKSEALDNLHHKGLPNHKNEDYKYFNVLRKLKSKYTLNFPSLPQDTSALLKQATVKDDSGIHIVFINGNPLKPLIPSGIAQEGIKFMYITANSNDLDQVLDVYSANRQNLNKDPYLDLNNAFFNTGFILNLDKKFRGKIYLYHIFTDAAEDLIVNPKSIILLNNNTMANITEIFHSATGKHYFHNHNTDIFVEKGARLNYYIVQESGENAVNINNINIYQKENSLVNAHNFSLKGKSMRNNLNVLLNEENCESHLYGLYYISDKDLIDNHTTVDHRKPHCFSNEFYKGIIEESGTGTFNGKIYVRPNAQKTNAFQSNKNLVLTDTATINTKPQLEIWADDVKCSHGATTGQLDEEQLFYLRSRGLSEGSAKALLLHAFAFEIVDKVDLEELRKYIASKINHRLGYQFSE